MSLEKKYPEEVKQILSKYPPEHKRAAVMPLLYLAQHGEGYLTKAAMQDVAKIVGITETDVAALVGYYTLYHEKKEGKYRLQVCTDLPCALRGAEEFMESLCSNLGIKVGETTADGFLTLEAVTCLAACDKAPMFQTQGPDGIKYHENMNVDRTRELISVLRKSNREVES
jgi:NADH-quinone oxidoreductase subunit E